MKLLTFTTLYPDSTRPYHGIFVETRLRHLVATGKVQSLVLAPVPWFPWDHRIFGKYAGYTRVPRAEERQGMRILHPRYPLIPRFGMTLAPYVLAATARAATRRIIAGGYDFDIIDAHYFYPDGVAAAMLAKSVGKPVVITARGSDLNLISKYRLPRKMIQWAAHRADAIITVCQALKDTLIGLGVPDDGKITVLRNGVDLQAFHPVDRQSCRARLGLTRTTLLSVGYLVELKGHHLAIEALAELPDAQLLIAGEGEEKQTLQLLAKARGVADRVTFLGAVRHDQLKYYYSAADALVLASSREGWANVLLEAMACGTPIIATRVGGIPEVVRTKEAGVLMIERSAKALVRAYHELFADYPAREATRRYAEQFGWHETSQGQIAVFEEAMARWNRAGRSPIP